MAISLSALLGAAQANTVRSPLVELRSAQTTSAIPFAGRPFNYDTTPETRPVLVAHSSGILIALWYRDGSIILSYSDADHISFREVTVLSIGSGFDLTYLDAAEISDGTIGVVYTKRNIYDSAEYIQRFGASTTGRVTSADSTIASYDADYDIKGVSFAYLNNGTYLITYTIRYDAGGVDLYTLYKRTSSNFSSWSGEVEISTGFTNTYRLYQTSVFQSAKDNDVVLFVSYATEVRDGETEKVDIYQLTSNSYGAGWSAPVKITDFAEWGRGGFEPSVDENSNQQMLLSYTDKTAALSMTTDTDLWLQDCGQYAIGARMHYDNDTGYLYVTNIYQYVGIKELCSVVVVDVNNWVVHRSYTTTTTPAYSDVFTDYSVEARALKSEGKYTVVAVDAHALVIDDYMETIIQYHIRDADGFTKNLTGLDYRGFTESTFEIAGSVISVTNNRLYMILSRGNVFTTRLLLGYIDLTEGPTGGLYGWTEIAWITDWTEVQSVGLEGAGGLLLLEDAGQIVVTSEVITDTWLGRTDVYDIGTGALVHEYSYNTDIGYPRQGASELAHFNGYLYGHFAYNSGYGQENHRGMVCIDLSTHAIRYLQPDYRTTDNYNLGNKLVTTEGLVIIAAQSDGVVTYNIDTGTWTRYNVDTNPDLEFGYSESLTYSVAYNEEDQIIYAGSPGAPTSDSFQGIRAFSLGGAIQRLKYLQGEKSGSWSWGPINDLTQGSYEQESYPAYLADDTLWVAWRHIEGAAGEQSIYYDNTILGADLTPYLTASGVTVTKSVKSAGKLSFELSHGYLFDQNNAGSSLARFVKKGHPIQLRFGELIGGTEHWSTQGTFYVDTFKMSYTRGKYPSARITCIDRTALLKWAHTVASEHFDYQYPEPIIKTLLVKYTNLTASEVDIDSFSTRHAINYQVVDEQLVAALEEILDHFQVYLYADADNRIVARPVRFSGTPDNTYGDNTKLVSFTPDDNFSDYTNQVTVKGEGLNPVEVLYDEELLATYSGSGGWWESSSETRDIYYSGDKKRKARNPRLLVLKSIADFEILWTESNGTEFLLSEDPNGFYCTIVIEFPGLAAVLIALLAAVIALGLLALWCDEYGFCGAMIMAFTILVSAVSYVLGQVATYDYEIHGRPYGEEKQLYQATANDTELQNFLDGLILQLEYEDPFCYTQAECQRVANYELQVLQAQRKRLAFSMVSDIQNEPGDIIRVKHPYTGALLDVFITDLTRTYKRGTVRKKGGMFIDKINGWRL